MLQQFKRYAVYWVPGRPDDLARFGASWTGWCAERGEPRPRHVTESFQDNIAAATRDLSLHGFHGVLKGPFRLCNGHSPWAVERALEATAEALVATPLPALELVVTDGQVALVPARSSADLSAALTRMEEALAPLVDAPAPAAGRQNGTAGQGDKRLSQLPAGAAHRFRLPFTDRLDIATAFRIRDQLAPMLAPMLTATRRIEELALMGDPGEGRPLRVLQRFDLRETPLGAASAALPCYGRPNLLLFPAQPLSDTSVAV
jgi:hypothetical protein